MKNFYKLLIWVIASLCAVPAYAEQELDLQDPFGFRFFILPSDHKTPELTAAETEKLKWFFLKDLLVAQPERTAQALNQQQEVSMKLLGSLGAGYLSYNISQKIGGYFNLNTTLPCKAISVILGFRAFIGCLSAHLVTPDHLRRIQLHSIMKLWPQIRNRIPEEVWPPLENLYTCWLKNDGRRYEGMVDKTLKSIDAAIRIHDKSTDSSELLRTLGGENR